MVPVARQPAPLRAAARSDRPRHYVRVPTRLLREAAYHPLLAGVYSLVARLFLVHKGHIALSAADLTRYDPALSRGAAERALARLVATHWLSAQTAPGQKTQYTPTWGVVHGGPLLWQADAARLGRPNHVRAVVLDLELLDTLMGKCVPHPTRGALVTRFVRAPLLTLADVGTYALALAGFAKTTDALCAWGLVADGAACPLPGRADLLARASQQAMDTPEAGLTPAGLRQLGPIAAGPPPAPGRPLFFVPPELIGTVPAMIPAGVIGHESGTDAANGRLPRPATGAAPCAPAIPWESEEIRRTARDSPQPPTRRGGHGHGQQTVAQAPTGATAQLLRTLHVRPAVVTELHQLPLAAVTAAVAHADAQPHVRDRAGWVVALLRAYRDAGGVIPAPPAPAAHGRVDWANEQAAYVAHQAAVVQAILGAHATTDAPVVAADAPAAAATDAMPAPESEGAADGGTAAALPGDRPLDAPLPTASPQAVGRDITAPLRAALRTRVVRHMWPILDRITAHHGTDSVRIRCANRADLQVIQAVWHTLIPAALRDLAVQVPYRVLVAP